MDKFDQMVEDLENNEDVVECKECFDLFPKAECVKHEHGYICPMCARPLDRFETPEISSRDLTVDLYDQEFPEVDEYNPGSTKDWEKEPTVNDALDALINDEVEAVSGYAQAAEVIEKDEPENKEEILDTIDHIKEEEEEHIEELKDLTSEKEAEKEAEDLDELLDANISLGVDGGENNKVSVLSSHEPEKSGEEDLDELLDANVNLSLHGGSGNDVSVLSPLHASLETEDLKETCTWICVYDGKEIGTVEAATEEEAAEKMQQKYPEYHYGAYDGCFEVYPEDEDCGKETETLTEEFNDEFVKAYEAAIDAANEAGVALVFGYAQKETDEFVAIDYIECDDPAEIDADLEAAYDDFGYAFFAYPLEPLTETLQESQLTEANIFTGEDKHLNSLFTSGYNIKVRGTSVQHHAATYKEAEKLAIRTSKAFPDKAVDLYGAALPKAEFDKMNPELKQLLAQTGVDTVIAVYNKGKAQVVDKAAKLTKALKDVAKYQKAVNKGSQAAENEEAAAAANASGPAEEPGAEATPAAETPEAKAEPASESEVEEEAEGKIDNTVIQAEAYELADKIFKNGYVYSYGTDAKLFKIDALSETAVAKLKNRSKASTENKELVFTLFAKAIKAEDFEVNGKSIVSELTRCLKGIELPRQLAGYKGKLYAVTSIQAGKRLEVKGQDLLERIQKQADIFNDLFSGDDVDSEEADDITSNSQDQEAAAEEELANARTAALNRLSSLKQEADGYTPESYAKYEKVFAQIDSIIKNEKDPKRIANLPTGKMLTQLNSTLQKVEEPAAEASDATPADDTSEPKIKAGAKNIAQAFKDAMGNISNRVGKQQANSLIFKALQDAGLKPTAAQQTAIRKALLGESLEDDDFEDSDTASGLKNKSSVIMIEGLDIGPIDFSECVDSSRVELWGLEEPEDGVARAVLIKAYDDVANDDKQSCHDEMIDLGGMFTFSFTASGKPTLWGWNADLLRELSSNGVKGISFDDLTYEDAVSLAWYRN